MIRKGDIITLSWKKKNRVKQIEATFHHAKTSSFVIVLPNGRKVAVRGVPNRRINRGDLVTGLTFRDCKELGLEL